MKNNWQAQMEYLTNISTLLSYSMMSTPALFVIERTGHPGTAKVEQALKKEVAG